MTVSMMSTKASLSAMYKATGSSQGTTGASPSVTPDPAPMLRVVMENFQLWDSNERRQCTWQNESGSNGNNNANGVRLDLSIILDRSPFFWQGCIGVDGHSVFAGGTLQTVQIKAVIGLRPEDWLAVVATLNDMQRQTFCEIAGQAGHEGMSAPSASSKDGRKSNR